METGQFSSQARQVVHDHSTSSLITSGSATLLVVHPTQTANYWVRDIGPACSADSATINIPICVPAITAQPANASINQGANATLTVAATANPTITYQWYTGTSGNTASPVSGGTSASLTISPATTTSYWVKVTSGSGGQCAINSNTATVTVCNTPSITQNPTSPIISRGQSATIGVTATGTSLSYQWYIGASGNTGSPVSGGTGTSLTVSPTATTSYWVRVSNSCGSVNSNTATVTVNTVTPTATSFYLVTPCRLLDTRNPNGPYGGPAIGANSVRNVVAAGQCGIPTGAASVALNITVILAPVNGWMILYPGPAGTSPPNTATINFTAGKIRGNNAIIPLGSDGSLNVINDSSTAQQFVIDVTGYFK